MKLFEELKKYYPNATFTKAIDWEIEDDEITINEKVHVQVGDCYFFVVEETKKNQFQYHYDGSDPKMVVKTVQSLVAFEIA